MIPGEIQVAATGDIELNAGRETIRVSVANHGDRPVQVGSHYHFYEVNDTLVFEREATRGFRLDIPVVRGGELRTQSISYALGFLAVLTVVHTARGSATRVISFRRASGAEREVYDAWLENECNEP